MSPRFLAGIAAIACLAMSCSSAGPSGRAGATSTSSSSTTSSSGSPVPLQPCLATSTAPARPAGPVTRDPVWTVIAGLNQPDELLYDKGTLYVGELGAGRIHLLSSWGSDSVLPFTIPKVEGMVFVSGTLYVADQQDDRIDVVKNGSVQTLLQLQPVAGQDGVDDIGAANGLLLVPDSPRGVLDWVDTSGRIVRSAGGFVRPTGAWPLPDGTILVPDEYGNSAFALHPDGTRTYLVRRLAIVDDIAADSRGRVFVVTPARNAGLLAELAGGSASVLVSGLLAPQGLAFDGADNAFVSEADAGRVDLVIRTFKVVPLSTGHAGANQPLCVDIVRGSGFTAPVSLSATGGMRVVSQPGPGTRGEVLVTSACTKSAPCTISATSGSLKDTFSVSAG